MDDSRDYELTTSQRKISKTLIMLYEETGDPVNAEAIAEEVDHHPGTVRNQLQSFATRDLVVGNVKEGFSPTAALVSAVEAAGLTIDTTGPSLSAPGRTSVDPSETTTTSVYDGPVVERCSACGDSSIPADASFCPSCGTEIRD